MWSSTPSKITKGNDDLRAKVEFPASDTGTLSNRECFLPSKETQQRYSPVLPPKVSPHLVSGNQEPKDT